MRAKPALLLDESKRSETGTNNGAANGRRYYRKEAGQRLAVSMRQIKRIVPRCRLGRADQQEAATLVAGDYADKGTAFLPMKWYIMRWDS